MDNLLIVIVIYETIITNSNTIQSLIKVKQHTQNLPDILLYDNSKRKQAFSNNDDDLDLIKYYFHDENNSGVAGAYNYACKLAIEKNKKWLTIFDQDTTLEKDFFTELYSAISESNELLFAPTVKTNGVIVSPSFYLLHKSIIYKNRKLGKKMNSSDYSVINSGLTISVEYLQKNGGFDAELPLDYSDHYFFYKYKKSQPSFYILNCCLQHNLSSYQQLTYEESLTRFRKYVGFTKIFSQKVKSKLPLFWLMLRALKLTVRYKKIEFVKHLF